jgi:hypothetical protein
MTREPCANADGSPKRSYPSRKAADAAARRTNRERRNDASSRSYLCPACRKFHVGHAGLEA